MEYSKAYDIGIKYFRLLKPYCDKIKIAGSLRRGRSEVGDIDIVCVPKESLSGEDLFSEEVSRLPEFTNLINSFPRVKGNGFGKYTRLILPEGLDMDLSMCNQHNFGVILMIRTGPSLFSERMVTDIKKNGFKVEGGFLRQINDGRIIPCPEEADFFRITGQEFIEPNLRLL